MKQGLLVVLAALGSMSLIGCAASKSPAEVSLRWHDTGKPVAGAEVWLQEGTKDGVFSGATGVTGQDGSVVLVAPENKTLMVSVSAKDKGNGVGYLGEVGHPKLVGDEGWTDLPIFRLKDSEPNGPAMDVRVSRAK